MEAGRELDALVAEKVMRHVVQRDEQGPYIPGEAGHKWPLPPYSTNMATAWPIAERLRLSVSPYGESQWCAGQPQPSETEPDTVETDIKIADTAPHVICLAALALHGIEVR